MGTPITVYKPTSRVLRASGGSRSSGGFGSGGASGYDTFINAITQIITDKNNREILIQNGADPYITGKMSSEDLAITAREINSQHVKNRQAEFEDKLAGGALQSFLAKRGDARARDQEGFELEKLQTYQRGGIPSTPDFLKDAGRIDPEGGDIPSAAYPTVLDRLSRTVADIPPGGDTLFKPQYQPREPKPLVDSEGDRNVLGMLLGDVRGGIRHRDPEPFEPIEELEKGRPGATDVVKQLGQISTERREDAFTEDIVARNVTPDLLEGYEGLTNHEALLKTLPRMTPRNVELLQTNFTYQKILEKGIFEDKASFDRATKVAVARNKESLRPSTVLEFDKNGNPVSKRAVHDLKNNTITKSISGDPKTKGKDVLVPPTVEVTKRENLENPGLNALLKDTSLDTKNLYDLQGLYQQAANLMDKDFFGLINELETNFFRWVDKKGVVIKDAPKRERMQRAVNFILLTRQIFLQEKIAVTGLAAPVQEAESLEETFLNFEKMGSEVLKGFLVGNMARLEERANHNLDLLQDFEKMRKEKNISLPTLLRNRGARLRKIRKASGFLGTPGGQTGAPKSGESGRSQLKTQMGKGKGGKK